MLCGQWKTLFAPAIYFWALTLCYLRWCDLKCLVSRILKEYVGICFIECNVWGLNFPITSQKSFVYLKKQIEHDQQLCLTFPLSLVLEKTALQGLKIFQTLYSLNSQPFLRISIMKDFVMKSGCIETGEGQPIYFTSSIDQSMFHPHGASSLKIEVSVLKASAISVWWY